MKSAGLIVVILAISSIGFSTTLHVPDDFPTIQEAIDAAVIGDTVLVAPGNYAENINFKGKAITVLSSDGFQHTFINGHDLDSVVTFENLEKENSILDGFTIWNGTSLKGRGGGIFCQASSPTLINNRIYFNSGWDYGGGIYVEGGSPLIQNNIITNNVASYGSGIYGSDSEASIIKTQIMNNGMGG